MATLPAKAATDIDAPDPDRLGVLRSTAPVVREGRSVTIVTDAIAALADDWAGTPWPEHSGLNALHYSSTNPARTANWILVLDALNFSFWGEPGAPRWRIEWRGATLDGYNALAAALTRAVEDEGVPLWDASFLANISAGELEHILRPVSDSPPIPLFTERLTNLREVGSVLASRYGGSFLHAVAVVAGDAVALVQLLAREFLSFNDVARWAGSDVLFYKRAQICVSDLNQALAGDPAIRIRNLGELTAFADYKLPQRLRQRGVLQYAPALAEAIDQQHLLGAGSAAEVEIRAATIWAVELLSRALRARGLAHTASAIDYRIWEESQRPLPNERPYHRTRTIYY